MTNFDAFAATVLEIYSRKNWATASPQLSHAISTLTGAKRTNIVLTREPCGQDCASLHDERLDGCSEPRIAGDGAVPAGDGHLRFCTPLEDMRTENGLRLKIDLEFLSREGHEIETGRKLVKALLPHFRQAVRGDRVRASQGPGTPASALVAGLLDTFSGRLAVINTSGALLDCNFYFSQLLVIGNTLVLDASGLLTFTAASDHQQFQAALADKRAAAFFTKGDGADPMIVSLHPLRKPGDGDVSTSQGLASEAGEPLLMWLRPKQPEAVSLQFLQPLFGLTRAETRVAEYVVQGLTHDEAAAKIGVSRITARNQLTSAMSKLGVNRQAQLVTLILNMFPRLR